HGGNQIPKAYRALFSSPSARAALETHRGYDLGALRMARALAQRFGVELYFSETSRLLVDLNRSSGHPRLFSEFSAPLDPAARALVLDRYYWPHRLRVERAITEQQRSGVVHIAIHSFTPELNGEVRRAEVGLLYDPASSGERRFCERWQRILADGASGLRVRRNYPYRGASDGFPPYLRRRFGTGRYWGIELETNQACLIGKPALAAATLATLSDSLAELIEEHCTSG
ncbi:MAG TPA: N-formylglutamate amidohydrolase, partial [Polyangiaceae bacterium]|nr:N-formylglutamate amidohydrolase [Polyangiaceae bacterium]